MRIETALYVQYRLKELGLEIPTTQIVDTGDSDR